MKRLLIFMLCFLLVMSVLAGCSKVKDSDVNGSSAVPSSSPNPGSDSSSTNIDMTSQVDEQGEQGDPKSVETILQAKEFNDINNPAKMGQWVKAEKLNPATEKYETIYWRVLSRTSDSKKDIDEYNAGDNIYKFDSLEAEELTYYIVNYEVYYPKDYTERENGILSGSIKLNAVNPTDKPYEVDGVQYVGLGSCHDMEVATGEGFKAGSIYEGKAVYAMLVKEPTYVFDYAYEKDGKEIHSYIGLEP